MVSFTSKDQAEWDGLMEEQADSVVPPGYMRSGEIVNRPTDDAPAVMRVSDLRFKGYVQVWDTQTGILSLQPWWLMWQTMRKKRPDGSLVFTRTDPKIAPNHGADLFCPLNPVSSEYPRLKGMGFKPCTKQHIPHEDALMRHVQKSHSRAWEAMERDREERIRQEDRKLQQDMLRAMTAAAVKGVAAPLPAAEPAKLFSATCDKCQRVFNDRTEGTARNNLRMHQRRPCKT